MAAEFYIVLDDPTWYEKNRMVVRDLIRSLNTFRKSIDDEEYWLRGDELGGDWAYGARIFVRPRDILLEISSHPPTIVNDIKQLTRFISEHVKTKVVDNDGESIDCYG